MKIKLSSNIIIIIKIIGAILILLAFMLMVTLKKNNLPMTSTPGLMKRLSIYLSINIAETSDNSIFPELKTPKYDLSPDELFSRVKKAIDILGWRIEKIDENNREIHAIIETKFFKFKDDIKIKVDFDQVKKSSLHIYSSSRVGKSDFGTNSKHILDIIEQIEKL